jgi:hypothetical protein
MLILKNRNSIKSASGGTMKNVESADLPSDKNSKKYFLLVENDLAKLPFAFVAPTVLTENGQKLVDDFRATKGEFLGGGVMRSKDFELQAKSNQNCMAIYLHMNMQLSRMPKSEQLRASVQLTSEWMAFEFSLVISLTIYGLIISIKWDEILEIRVSEKRFGGQAKAHIKYLDKKGDEVERTIESNVYNIRSLSSIARACNVSVV